MEVLLGAGADVNGERGEHGTVLQAASHYGFPDVVKLLVQRGAKVTTHDSAVLLLLNNSRV